MGDLSQYPVVEKVTYTASILQTTTGKIFEHTQSKAIPSSYDLSVTFLRGNHLRVPALFLSTS